MTRHLASTLAVLAAATTIATGYGAAAHAETTPVSSADGGLVVTPGSALFDVALAAGVPEVRELTVTNTSAVDLDVQLSVILSDGAPTDHRMDHLELHATGDYAACDATVMDGAETITFADVHRVDQESVAAGSSKTICVGVLLPTDTPPMDAATTMVDFQFHALDAGTGPGDDELPFTGTDALRFLPTAIFALLTGGFLAWMARRRREHTPADDSATAPMDQTR
ncbi:hypothetical protein [Plantibacter sp. YIM 135347]|uniref:hypothetical protein n=1 Tax=Plantibacter sp. YIM 135347 TaxID=3423919 RepID=UPI003D32BDBA